MKTFAFVVVLLAPAVLAQSTAPVILEAGPHHRVIEWIEEQVAVDGQRTAEVHQYTELATGLHYQDEATGEWLESVAAFELLPQGYAVAARGQHKVLLAGNINQGGSVDLEFPDGSRMLSNPMGLSYFDASSGRNVLLAEVKDCAGVQVAPNMILFPDAFDGLKAALRYTYTLAGCEQDMILLEDPGPPELYGLDPVWTTLEAYTEFFTAPEPEVRFGPEQEGDMADAPMGYGETADPAAESDPVLDFGSMRMERGTAYFLHRDLDDAGVDKSWELLDGRRFLIERIAYVQAAPLLEKLPLRTSWPEAGELGRRTTAGRAGFAGLVGQRGRGVELAMGTGGSHAAAQGLVLDYIITLNSSQTNYVFRADSTYHVVGTVDLYGAAVLEGGAVLKYANTNSPRVRVYGTLSCETSSYRPTIFTAKDDNSVGATISGSSGSPSGRYALNALYYSSSQPADLEHVRVRYATNGIVLAGQSGHRVRHVQSLECDRPISVLSTTLTLQNALLERSSVEAIYLTGTAPGLVGEHVTIHGAARVVNSTGLTLTNSLLVSVTNWTYTFAGAHNATNSSTNVFQWAGAGAHYLAAGSPYRNAGSTNLSAGLWAELRQRTTYPPLVLSGPITTPTVLNPVVARGSGLPDLGFHYAPLDYLVSNVVVQAALTFTNGVAIGTYGTSGFNLQTASPIRGEGTPVQLNRLVHPQNVQEQGIAWGVGPQFAPNGGNPGPDLRLRWSECSPLPGTAGSLFSSGGSTAPFSMLSYQDCVLRGGSLQLQPASSSAVLVALTNNLLERCSVGIYRYYYSQNTPMAAHLYNNLFRGGSLSMSYHYGSGMQTWNVKDNLFDGATQSFDKDGYGESMVQRSHNGFITNTATIFGGTGSRTNLVADFQSGPLGRFYYPASGGSSSLTNLVNTGSRLASAAGLYHFTTTTNQVKEAATQVDIGYHCVALDANGLPVDTDGDGIPDYLEDRNGDGSPTGDPTSWQSYNSANGLTGNPGLLVFTPLR